MKFICILFISVFLNFFGNSQSLQYTIWFGTNPPSPNMYFMYGFDTLSYSMSGGYTPLSTFGTNGNQLWIKDLSASHFFGPFKISVI